MLLLLPFVRVEHGPRRLLRQVMPPGGNPFQILRQHRKLAVGWTSGQEGGRGGCASASVFAGRWPLFVPTVAAFPRRRRVSRIGAAAFSPGTRPVLDLRVVGGHGGGIRERRKERALDQELGLRLPSR